MEIGNSVGISKIPLSDLFIFLDCIPNIFHSISITSIICRSYKISHGLGSDHKSNWEPIIEIVNAKIQLGSGLLSHCKPCSRQ